MDLNRLEKSLPLQTPLCQSKEENYLGDAIKCGERHIGEEPFVVLLGDSIASFQHHAPSRGLMFTTPTIPQRFLSRKLPSTRWKEMESSMERKLKRMSTRSTRWLKSVQGARHQQTLHSWADMSSPPHIFDKMSKQEWEVRFN